MTTAMTETEERLCLDVGTLFEKTAKLRGRVNSLEESLPPKHDALVDRVVGLEDRVSDLQTAMVAMAQAGKAKTLADDLTLDAVAELNARLRAQERGVTDICNQLIDMTNRLEALDTGQRSDRVVVSSLANRLTELEADREPVQQDCECEELWRLARDYVREADRGNGSNVAATALQVYVRESVSVEGGCDELSEFRRWWVLEEKRLDAQGHVGPPFTHEDLVAWKSAKANIQAFRVREHGNG